MSAPDRVHHHPVLGTLVFDSTMYWWQAESPVRLGQSDLVSLTVNGEPDLPADRFDETAGLLSRLDPRALRHEVAEYYLELYNDTWRQDGDDELDSDQFSGRIGPTAVEAGDDGLSIYFHDGDLFGGHSFVMYLDRELNVTDVVLAG
jgi:hypothetical protein